MSVKVDRPSPDLQDRLRFEAMLADLSSRFVNFEPADVDREIEDAQRRVCECLDRETWTPFGVKSVLTFSLSSGGESIFGFLGFHAVGEEHRWSDETVQRLRLVSQIFANLLVRKRADAVSRESGERVKLAAEVGMWTLRRRVARQAGHRSRIVRCDTAREVPA